jgi:ATP phosphoribosyltransferase
MNRGEPIRLALPSKGNLSEGALALFAAAGFRIKRPNERVYEARIAGHPRFHVVFMRPSDIVAQVEEGRCQLGVTGGDIFAEHAREEAWAERVLPDLGYGQCRLAVAVPESWIDVTHLLDLVDLTTEFKAEGRTFRVSTKYPRLVREHFRRHGIFHYQLIASDGALELHPNLGIADVIVDLVSSGSTLRENRLREIEGGVVLESSACLIGHVASLESLVSEGPDGELARCLDAIDAVRGAEEWLQIEILGQGGAIEHVGRFLEERGARGAGWSQVRSSAGECWRASALIPRRGWEALPRGLRALGAIRISAVEPRLVSEIGADSSWDRLSERMRLRG